ncbi:MAG: methionine gamma-lyase family protein [Bacillota bacterium]|nr:methionine gamma-lyase family protein [Bacillota bacterium]
MDPKAIELLSRAYGIDGWLIETAERAQERVLRPWAKMDGIAQYNQAKVLEAFHYARVSEACLRGSTGYGYRDSGREKLDQVYARAFGAEAALVRSQFVSGTHAIACALFAMTAPRRPLICATGTPYVTLKPVIGKASEPGTVAGQGSSVSIVEVAENGSIDTAAILKTASKLEDPPVVFLQRSCGYTWRESFTVGEIGSAIQAVRAAFPEATFVVDNCYGEFVEDAEPAEAGADLICGSLIKNPGGGLCATGGYVAGKAAAVERVAARLTCPGAGAHVGSLPSGHREQFEGFFLAPTIVAQAVKGAIFAGRFFEDLGFEVLPHPAAPRSDIIQGVKLGSRERVQAFCRGVQRASAVDAFVKPVAALLPGYEDDIIMAGGTFVQGSSIELSCDAPMREPYAVFLQGGLSAEHSMIGATFAAHEMGKEDLLPNVDRSDLP